jgi:serine/threonine protein kinase
MGSCCSWLTGGSSRSPSSDRDEDKHYSREGSYSERPERPLLHDKKAGERKEEESIQAHHKYHAGAAPNRNKNITTKAAGRNNNSASASKSGVGRWPGAGSAGLTMPSGRSTPHGTTTSSAARSLKEYELVAFIGNGTFAEVTLARHRTTQELFAIKKISKRKVAESGGMERAVTERRLLGALSHPFLVTLHQAFQSAEYLYLVLDFAQGGDFYDFLVKRRVWKSISAAYATMVASPRLASSPTNESLSSPLPAETNLGSSVAVTEVSNASSSISFSPFDSASAPSALSRDLRGLPVLYVFYYAVEIALVLSHLHQQGFVYRDLKPENILLRADGHVMLTDFGVAMKTTASAASSPMEGGDGDTGGSRIPSFVGTGHYMSPEMLLNVPHSAATDWWSYGCLLFELVNGRRPFESDSEYMLFKAIVEEELDVEPGDFSLRATDFYVPYSLLASRRGGSERGPAAARAASMLSFATSATSHASFAGSDASAGSSFYDPTVFMAAQAILQANSVMTMEETSDGGVATGPAIVQKKLRVLPGGAELEAALHHLQHLCCALLTKDQTRRLGGADVLAHPFFHQPYLLALFQLQSPANEKDNNGAAENYAAKFLSYEVSPPFLPHLKGPADLRNFPSALTIASIVAQGGAKAAQRTDSGLAGPPAVSLAEADMQRKRHLVANKRGSMTEKAVPRAQSGAAEISSSARKNTAPSDELYLFMMSLTGGGDDDDVQHQEQAVHGGRVTLQQHSAKAPVSSSSVLDYYDDCDFILPSVADVPEVIFDDDNDENDDADQLEAASSEVAGAAKQRRGASIMGKSSADSASTAGGFLWGAKYDDEDGNSGSRSNRKDHHYPGFTFDGRSGKNFLDLA